MLLAIAHVVPWDACRETAIEMWGRVKILAHPPRPGGYDFRMPSAHRINEQIRSSPVQVVTLEGELLFLGTAEAIALARRSGLDLVEIGPDAQPPVCRIMDYGKFVYEQRKRRTWPWPPLGGEKKNGSGPSTEA